MALSKHDAALVADFIEAARAAVRDFDGAIAGDQHTPAEARLLHEIGQRGQTRAMVMSRDLNMDRGQMSRLILKLVDLGHVATQPASDRRSNMLVLTSEGELALGKLEAARRRAAEKLVGTVEAAHHTKLLAAMAIIGTLYGDDG